MTNLSAFAGAVAQKQAQMEQVWGILPVALQNLNNAIDPATGALRARVDEVSQPKTDRSFESDDPECRSYHVGLFIMRCMRRVIGRNAIDGAVFEARNDRVDILLRS